MSVSNVCRGFVVITKELLPVNDVACLTKIWPPKFGQRQHCVAMFLLLSQMLLFAGCRPDTDVQPGDIRRYTAPREQVLPAGELAVQQSKKSATGRQVSYTLPAGWTEKAGASGMRLATVAIGNEDDGNEVTIIPAAGTLRSNVERWQKQLDTDATPEQITTAVDQALSKSGSVDVDGRRATIVLLLPAAVANTEEGEIAGEAILGGVLPLDEGKAIFVKFRGPAEIARREQKKFTTFVGSLRLP